MKFNRKKEYVMRRYTALALAAIVLLSASCGRQTAPAETTQAEPSLTAADNTDIALPETTQEAVETPLSTEAETTTTPPTTQPPASTTTTQPPSTTTAFIDESKLNQPPEDGSVPFSAKFVRISRRYEDGFSQAATVADNRDSLNDLLSAGNAYSGKTLPEETEAYTDEWFETHRLIVIALQESTGSARHNVRSVTYTESGAVVKLKRLCPNVTTCDIAHWLIFIELPDTSLHGSDPVELIWE